MLHMLGQSEFGLYSLAASLIAYLTVLDLGLETQLYVILQNFKPRVKTMN